MTEDEFGATSIGTDASPKLTLKAVGDSAIYEFKMTRAVAAGLALQLSTALGAFDGDEPAVGNVVEVEGTASLSGSAKG